MSPDLRKPISLFLILSFTLYEISWAHPDKFNPLRPRAAEERRIAAYADIKSEGLSSPHTPPPSFTMTAPVISKLSAEAGKRSAGPYRRYIGWIEPLASLVLGWYCANWIVAPMPTLDHLAENSWVLPAVALMAAPVFAATSIFYFGRLPKAFIGGVLRYMRGQEKGFFDAMAASFRKTFDRNTRNLTTWVSITAIITLIPFQFHFGMPWIFIAPVLLAARHIYLNRVKPEEAKPSKWYQYELRSLLVMAALIALIGGMINLFVPMKHDRPPLLLRKINRYVDTLSALRSGEGMEGFSWQFMHDLYSHRYEAARSIILAYMIEHPETYSIGEDADDVNVRVFATDRTPIYLDSAVREDMGSPFFLTGYFTDRKLFVVRAGDETYYFDYDTLEPVDDVTEACAMELGPDGVLTNRDCIFTDADREGKISRVIIDAGEYNYGKICVSINRSDHTFKLNSNHIGLGINKKWGLVEGKAYSMNDPAARKCLHDVERELARIANARQSAADAKTYISEAGSLLEYIRGPARPDLVSKIDKDVKQATWEEPIKADKAAAETLSNI